MVNNVVSWAQDGWGGAFTSGAAVLINPILNSTEAEKSMKPLTELINSFATAGDTGAKSTMTTFSSWGSFFPVYQTLDPSVTLKLISVNK